MAESRARLTVTTPPPPSEVSPYSGSVAKDATYGDSNPYGPPQDNLYAPSSPSYYPPYDYAAGSPPPRARAPSPPRSNFRPRSPPPRSHQNVYGSMTYENNGRGGGRGGGAGFRGGRTAQPYQQQQQQYSAAPNSRPRGRRDDYANAPIAFDVLFAVPVSVWQKHGFHPPMRFGDERQYFADFHSTGNFGAARSVTGQNAF